MPTLLVTKRMSPELAARVQTAVSGRQSAGAKQRPLTALLRVATCVFVLAAIFGWISLRRRTESDLESARAALLQAMRTPAGTLTRSDWELPQRVSASITLEAAAAYAGDFFVEELKAPHGIERALEVPTLYLRGPQQALLAAGRLPDLASSSSRDAFLYCLFETPEARTEKALRAKASAAYARGAAQRVAPQVERLDPLLKALPLVSRAWQARVLAAESIGAVATLQKLFDAAPVQAAVRAAKARQLLLVIDEPGSPGGPTELDGERAHPVRVLLKDLTSGEARLRFRRGVDPSWLSDKTRSEYASGVDSCALALDLSNAAAGRPATPDLASAK